MKLQIRRFMLICLTIAFTFAGAFNLAAYPAKADSPIKILATSTVSKFRQSFTFHAKISSSAGQITSARLIYNLLGDETNRVFRVKDLTPAPEIEVVYQWDTRNVTTPPWQIVVYSWQVTDSAGNSLKSDP